jgi:hypothetical protein
MGKCQYLSTCAEACYRDDQCHNPADQSSFIAAPAEANHEN